jgi:hypothetical protein
VRAYAHDLKTFGEFVDARDLAWNRASLERLREFTACLRQPADNVVVLATGRPTRSAARVNRILSGVRLARSGSVCVTRCSVAVVRRGEVRLDRFGELEERLDDL